MCCENKVLLYGKYLEGFDDAVANCFLTDVIVPSTIKRTMIIENYPV